MSPISTKQQKVKTVMVNKCHQYQQNNRKLKQDGQHMSPISTKQQKVKTVIIISVLLLGDSTIREGGSGFH
jgi:hypothetical protein